MKRLLSILLTITIIFSTFAGLQISSNGADLPSSGKCGKNVYYTFDSETGLLTIRGIGDTEKYNYPYFIDGDGYRYYYADSPFANKEMIKKVVIENGVTNIGDALFYGCSKIIEIIIPNSVTSIGKYAFCKCTGLTSVIIGDSVTTVGNYAFNECINLSSVLIGNSVTSIGNFSFARCESLTEISIPNNVLTLGGAVFFSCTNLTKVTIGSGVSSLKSAAENYNGTRWNDDDLNSIIYGTFSECEKLEEIIIPANVTSMRADTFKDSGLKKITFLNGNLSINYPPLYDEGIAFSKQITQIVLDENVVEYSEDVKKWIGESSITELNIPETWTYIPAGLCKDCKTLTTATIPKSVTRIEYDAFSGCTNLTIRGYKDSYAETFCKWAGIPFEVIEEPHTHEYTDVVTPPTCTEQGYTTHTCECGDVLVDTYVDSLGHDYVANIVTPKANAVGYTHYKCSRCSDLKKDEAGNIIKDNFTAPTGKPAGFKCASRTARAEKFTWTKTSGVSGYQVQLLNSAGKNAGTVTTTGNAYTFAKLAAGHAYKARVRFYIKAADGKNYYGAWSTIVSPTLPKGTTLTSLARARKAFTAKWKKGACTGYQLQFGRKANFKSAKTVTIKKVGTLKYTVKSLTAKKAYYVRVRTYKTMAGANYFSTWSGAKAVKTK